MTRQSFLLVVAIFALASVLVAPFVSFADDARGFWIPWELATAGFRPWNAYSVDGCNYPPVILYVVSVVEFARSSLLVSGQSRVNLLLLKLPSFAAQLVGAACLYRSLRGELGTRAACGIAAAWLGSPALFVNAAFWCQWDAFLALFAVLAMLAFRSRRPFATGVWTALALATKVQAIFLLPVLGVSYLATRNVRDALLASAGAAIAIGICFAPFALTGRLHDATAVYVASVDSFQRRTVNAWNVWYIANVAEVRGITIAKTKARLANDSRAVFPDLTRRFTHKHLGMIAFGAYVAAMLVVVARRRRIDHVIVGVPLCGVAMFLLATQMHERYLAPPAAMMVLWLPLGRVYRWHFVYWTLSAALDQAYTMARFGFLFTEETLGGFDEVGVAVACLNLLAFGHLSWLFFKRRVDARDPPDQSIVPNESCVS